MSEKYKNDMNRRDFLGNSTALAVAVGAGKLLLTGEPAQGALCLTVNKSPGYELARKVWDLSQKAWRERYRPTGHGFYSGVIGVVNLASERLGHLEEPAHYLMIRSNEVSKESGLPKEYYGPTLELIAIKGIDPETAKGIDNYLDNLGFRCYVPPMDNVIQKSMERIQETRGSGEFRLAPVAAALIAIWNEKILDYAQKHKLPVLRLGSGLEGDLGTLHSVGWRIGDEPKASDWYFFPERQKTAIERQIIGEKYLPILAKAILPLELEVHRIENLRFGENPEITKIEGKLFSEELTKQNQILKERRSRKIAAMQEKENKTNQILTGALEYPI